MERRSRSTSRKAAMLPGEHSHSAGPASLGSSVPPPLMPHQRQASIGRIPFQELQQHSSLHARPGGDSRTLSPDRRPMPKTSPYHSSMLASSKSGSYNGYTHPPPPPLVPPPNSSSISSASTIAMGSTNHYNGTSQNYPQPPPRAPVSTSTPQSTPAKADHHHHKSSVGSNSSHINSSHVNSNLNNRVQSQQQQHQQPQVGIGEEIRKVSEYLGIATFPSNAVGVGVGIITIQNCPTRPSDANKSDKPTFDAAPKL